MKHGRIGDYVKILEGNGIDSRKVGELITFEKYKALGGDKDDFILWRNQGKERKKIAFIELAQGKPIVTFKHSVEKINPTPTPKRR